MILPIGENHRIRGTKKEWLLEECYTAKKRETDETYDRWKILGHYSEFEDVVNALVYHQLRVDDAQTIQDALKATIKIALCVVGACERHFLDESIDNPPEWLKSTDINDFV